MLSQINGIKIICIEELSKQKYLDLVSNIIFYNINPLVIV